MIIYAVAGSILGFLISLLLIRHRDFEIYCKKKAYIGIPIAMTTQVTVEVLVMIVSTLVTGFGTVLYWLNLRLNNVEDEVAKLKISVLGNPDDESMKGHDEEIAELMSRENQVRELRKDIEELSSKIDENSNT